MYPCCEVNNVDYAAFLRQRITELRMKINVSEYQMSLELGQNKNYIQGTRNYKTRKPARRTNNLPHPHHLHTKKRIYFYDG